MRQKTGPPPSDALKPLMRALARIFKEDGYLKACEEHPQRNGCCGRTDDSRGTVCKDLDRDGDESYAAVSMFGGNAEMITDRYLRRNEVERITSLSRSTIYRRMEQGTFPRPYEVGGSTVRWLESDLKAWMSQHKLT